MDALNRILVGVRLLFERHPRRVWLLWGLATLLLILTPFTLLDPAAWIFVLDPELAAIVALVGFASLRAGALRLLWHPLVALARLPRTREPRGSRVASRPCASSAPASGTGDRHTPTGTRSSGGPSSSPRTRSSSATSSCCSTRSRFPTSCASARPPSS